MMVKLSPVCCSVIFCRPLWKSLLFCVDNDVVVVGRHLRDVGGDIPDELDEVESSPDGAAALTEKQSGNIGEIFKRMPGSIPKKKF